MRSRDQQRSKVYTWEDSKAVQDLLKSDSATALSLDECRELAESVCKKYGVPPVNIKDGRRRTRACWSPNENSIKLPRWSRSKYVVLHECAHALVDRHYRIRDAAWHGPEFMRVYIDLLSFYLKGDVSMLRSSARDAGLKVAAATSISKPKKSSITKIEKLKADRKKLRDEILQRQDQIQRINSEIRQLESERTK